MIKIGRGPPRQSAGMQAEKVVIEFFLITFASGNDEKLKQAVLIKDVAKLENSASLEEVWAESEINF